MAKNKGVSDPEEIKISRLFRRKVIMMQNMIYTIHPFQTGTSRYWDYKHD
ncbi:hypothetical protein [Peribacillus aracenensis]|nr:hypothetical protein [Peribacillus sp. BBB004]